jgi:Ca2+-binding EF-hand superfamily protein
MLSKQFGMTDALLMDRIFKVFDTDADNFVAYDEFIRQMSVFLKGTTEEQIRYCFKVYDLNSDRYISKEEMLQMLQHCLIHGSDEDEDGVKDLVDIVLKKLDEDRDGRVNEQDFQTAVQKDTLLLEVFGQCLPQHKEVARFLQ